MPAGDEPPPLDTVAPQVWVLESVIHRTIEFYFPALVANQENGPPKIRCKPDDAEHSEGRHCITVPGVSLVPEVRIEPPLEIPSNGWG